jgi:superfamily II DNA or RNA helicase
MEHSFVYIFDLYVCPYYDKNKKTIKIGLTTNLKERIKPYYTIAPHFRPLVLYLIHGDEKELRIAEALALKVTEKWMPLGIEKHETRNIEKKEIEILMKLIDSIFDEYNIKREKITSEFNKYIDMDGFRREYEQHCRKEDEERRRIIDEADRRIRPTIDKYELRGFQLDCYRQLGQAYESKIESVLLWVFCGGGKTVLFSKFINDYYKKFDHIILIAPRLTLIYDIIERLKIMFNQNFKFKEISSSQSNYAVNNEELYRIIRSNEQHFLVACNKSLQRLLENIDFDKKYLIIIDEAHHSNRLGEQVKVLKNILLRCKNSFVIHATATPIFGQHLEKQPETSFFLDDPNFIKKTLQYNDIEIGMEQKFLTPLKLIIGTYNKQEFDKEKQQLYKITDEVDFNAYQSLHLLQQVIDDISMPVKPSKILTYVNSKLSANRIADIFKQSKLFNEVYIVHSDRSKGENNTDIENFRKNPSRCCLINIQMVTDGINIVDLDTVMIIEPRQSKQDLMQIAMRPRRFNKDNPSKISFVIMPYNDRQAENYLESTYILLTQLHESNEPSLWNLFPHEEKNINAIRQSRLQNFKVNDDVKIDLSCTINTDLKAKILDIKYNKINNLQTFILLLRANNIQNHQDYLKFRDANQTFPKEYLPIFPQKKFENFEWSMVVDVNLYYPFDISVQKTNEIVRKNKDILYNLPLKERYEFIHNIDKKIPIGWKEYYNRLYNFIED